MDVVQRDAIARVCAARAKLLLAHQSMAEALPEGKPRNQREAAIREWELAISAYVESIAKPTHRSKAA
jgi:hypothetical protein